ncbi:MAG TPA: hypothetical protein VEZ88_11335 [Steroidobacteraceae bacterium]|nr:hypothetical protein [Steroidobacteraceae bacterium]
MATAAATEMKAEEEKSEGDSAQPANSAAEADSDSAATESAASAEQTEESEPRPRAGYSMIEKDGRTLYCRKVKAAPGTGSRLSAVTECRTAAQLDAEQSAARK